MNLSSWTQARHCCNYQHTLISVVCRFRLLWTLYCPRWETWKNISWHELMSRAAFKIFMMLCWIWAHSWHWVQTTRTHTLSVCFVRTAWIYLGSSWEMVALPSPCHKLQRLAGCACWVADKTMSEVCRRLLSTAQQGCYGCVPYNIQTGLFDPPEVQRGSDVSWATCWPHARGYCFKFKFIWMSVS